MLSAQYYVELVRQGICRLSPFNIEARDEALSSPLVRDTVEDRVERLQGISGEVHLGDQARKNARAKERQMDVSGAPSVVVIPPGVRSRFDAAELVTPFGIGEDAA